MTALKEELINYISNIPDDTLAAIQPLLYLFLMQNKSNKKNEDDKTIGEISIGEIVVKSAPRQGPGMITHDDFSVLKIDTRGWKFNREEAYDRK